MKWLNIKDKQGNPERIYVVDLGDDQVPGFDVKGEYAAYTLLFVARGHVVLSQVGETLTGMQKNPAEFRLGEDAAHLEGLCLEAGLDVETLDPNMQTDESSETEELCPTRP